jgi:cell division septum initiation protein DivIVA
MAEAERYGVNIVAAQLDDPLTQEAFRDQERVNAELKAKINSLTSQVASLRAMVQEQAETLAILMDG